MTTSEVVAVSELIFENFKREADNYDKFQTNLRLYFSAIPEVHNMRPLVTPKI